MLIVIAAIAAGFFVYPKGFGASNRPWQLGLDLVGGSHLVYSIDLSQVSSTDQSSVVAGLRDVIEKRVDLFGVSEPQVYTAQSGNTAQLDVDLAGVKDITQAISEIGQTPLLQFAEVDTVGSTTQYVPTNLTGQYVTGAQLTFDPTTGAPEVTINFNSDGADIFGRMTAANIGKPLAIFLDNQLIEAPIVQQAITGGSALISGGFTVTTAQQLVERFNAGALPAPITLINQQTISPTLGAEFAEKSYFCGYLWGHCSSCFSCFSIIACSVFLRRLRSSSIRCLRSRFSN